MRYYYIDLIRGILMSLGVVLHSSIVYCSDCKWRVCSHFHAPVFDYIYDFIHSFRMESFYIISGFFSMMLFEKYSLKKIIKSRMLRLGVPLLFIGITLNSLMNYFSRKNSIDLFSTSYWFGGFWLGHLWFLANLIGYSILLLISMYYFNKYIFKVKNIKFNYYYYVFFIALLVFLFKRIGWHLPEPPYGGRHWLIIDQYKFMMYLPYFITGIIFYLNKELFASFNKAWLLNTFFVLLGLSLLYGIIEVNSYAAEFIKAIYGITFSGLLFGLFERFFNKPNDISYTISDASYTVYVLHQPIIVILGYFIIKMNINLLFEFSIIMFSALLIPYFFHIKVVKKNSWVGILLNGKNYKSK